jgi:hypothetical protein
MSSLPVRPNHRRNRARRILIGTAVVAVVAGFNGPALYRYGSEKYHDYTINKPEYKAANGHWDFLDVPSEFRINTIHAALLHTGKVLLVAGSGNNQKNFDANKFESVLWDPRTNKFKMIPTPKDMFCAGHTQLPDGKLLIAGGTKRYEKLKGDVTKAGGLMIVHNEDPDKPITLPAGTKFTGKANGKTFVSKDPILVEKAEKVFDKATGRFLRTQPGLGRIYVEAEESGKEFETGTEDNYKVVGLKGKDARNVYGMAQKLALDKKDFQGIRDAFEFDPVAEKYIKVDPMNEARWYPTLTTLKDGKVLALSGLDEIGQIVPGKDEIYDPKTKKWEYTGIERRFPTYPAIFLMDNGKLFYSGSNAGPERRRPDGDVRHRHAAARPGPEVHGHRRRRRRRVAGLQREVPAGRPQGSRPPLQGRCLPRQGHPLPERLADAGRHRPGHRRLRGLPGARRLQRAGGADLRPEDRDVHPCRRPAGGPQLPLGVGAAARRPCDDLRLGLALRRQGQHQAGRLRAAHRDLHPALPLP